MKITILDPAMCCSTGVCGPDVDDSLVQTAANVKWLKTLNVEVARHNISNDSIAFQEYPEALVKLKMDGLNSLPFILKDGKIIMAGRYPDRSEWENLIKNNAPEENKTENTSCCGGSSNSCC
ncbi:MAG TPA: arsenite efflux transporter metallochaperone ArsD [Gillisia sp.]|nr:arsenite efflux transporter metallochaperone ArsD [Gillisia sp.]